MPDATNSLAGVKYAQGASADILDVAFALFESLLTHLE